MLQKTEKQETKNFLDTIYKGRSWTKTKSLEIEIYKLKLERDLLYNYIKLVEQLIVGINHNHKEK